MKSFKTFLIIVLAIATCVPSFAQKRKVKPVKAYTSQYALTSVILNELKRNFGTRSITTLKKVKTKKEFVGFLKARALKCKSCPTIVEFSGKLAVVDEKYSSRLTYGQHLVDAVTSQSEEGTDPDEDTEPDEDPDVDTDGPAETEDPEGGGCPPCGPLTCLSYWGEHIPCCDMP